MSENNKISKQEAKQLVEQSDFGYLIVGDIEPIPVIGEVDPEEIKHRTDVDKYEFGKTDCVNQ